MWMSRPSMENLHILLPVDHQPHPRHHPICSLRSLHSPRGRGRRPARTLRVSASSRRILARAYHDPRGFLSARGWTWTGLPHGDAQVVREGDEKQGGEDVEPDATADEAVEAAASPSIRAKSPVTETPPADAGPSPAPPVRLVESAVDVDALHEDVHDVSTTSDATDYHHELDQDHDQDLLMVDGVEDPYRSSPQSPSPAPESASERGVTPEPAPRVLEEGEADDDTLLREPAVTGVVLPDWGGARSPAWGPVSPEAPAPVSLARDPTPPPAPPPAPAPPPVVKVAFKEWQARRKLERAKEEEAQEREREREKQQQQELEREREREREKEKEKEDAQGEDKENKVVAKPEDGLTRILDGIRRSAVGDKAPPDDPVRDDVVMADAAPVPRVPSPPPSAVVSVEAPTPKAKGTPLTLPAFVATGPEHLSPLSVSSSLHSRTPSPRLVNGLKREPSPLVVNEQVSPPIPNGVFKYTPLEPFPHSFPPPRAIP
ncbi:hypothetical protein C8F04DRAFT_314532 [Mycena alexandri]|uniref:Uncharacterized protein n=1 Tax=Mycena alexandri TaxID=1745969 RepID=A0AAD6WT41_9AGAR|nr:hypothetical protein C8F04DRAFT_314532 [Mycena alexandri]